MKLSKLLLLTFFGLVLTIIDVTVDTRDRDRIISAAQLTTTAKNYLHSFSDECAVAYTKVKDGIQNATYNIYMNNDQKMALNTQTQLPEFDN